MQSRTAVFYGEINGRESCATAYEDDLIVMSAEKSTVDFVKQRMRDAFVLKDSGPVSEFFGAFIDVDDQGEVMHLHQEEAIWRCLKRFGMCDYKPTSTPMKKDVEALLREDSKLAVGILFREQIGTLRYFMTYTSPDIAFAGTLAQYSDSLAIEH